MVSLSVGRINLSSPYVVEPSAREGYVQFRTDSDIVYYAGFDRADELLSQEVYQFIIINSDGKKSPRDPKLRDTVIAIISEFFESSRRAMLYICETGDGKQAMRSRLFDYWYRSSARKSNFSVLTVSITDEEGIDNYATLVVRLDNPDYQQIILEFTETVSLLSTKPEE